eukprot:Amastigsp_a680668_181.p2 type:complete len:117 gc:universal Amastigsp_a680668_181:503-153(-)
MTTHEPAHSDGGEQASCARSGEIHETRTARQSLCARCASRWTSRSPQHRIRLSQLSLSRRSRAAPTCRSGLRAHASRVQLCAVTRASTPRREAARRRCAVRAGTKRDPYQDYGPDT